MPSPKLSNRWFLRMDGKSFVFRKANGEPTAFACAPEDMAFFSNRFEVGRKGLVLTYYYRDAPTLEKGFVIWSEEAGIYLGEAMGLGFWTKMDAVGQELAPVFESKAEIEKWRKSLPPEAWLPPYIAWEVRPDWAGHYASIHACVQAGLPAWEPDKKD